LLALGLAVPVFAVSVGAAPLEESDAIETLLAGLPASHELGWLPDDDLSVTALEQFADLLPNVDRIAGAPPPDHIVRLGIEEAITLTLENSTALEQASFTPRIRAQDVGAQRGSIFDTTFTAILRGNGGESPTSSTLDGAAVSARTNWSASAGLGQRLATGAMLDLSYSLSYSKNNSSFSNLNPVWNNSVDLSARQPLLRGFGPTVTRQAIRSADLSAQASEQDYRNTVINTVQQSMNTYWDLYFADRQALVRLRSLEQARLVLRNNRIRRDVGDMTRAEVLQAESVVAQREGDYFSSLRSIQDTEDALWILIDRTGEAQRWDYGIEPTEIPGLEQMPLSEEQLIQLAMQNRPDLQSAQLNRDRTELSRRVAANGLLPQLDLFGSYGFSGLGGEPGHAHEQTVNGSFEQWTVGLELSYPLQNRAARHRMRAAELSLEQAEVGLESLRLNILLDVRNTLRRLQNAIDLAAARDAEVTARAAELQDEQRRYEVGLSTTELLLRFQDDTASAAINALSARVEYAKAMIALDQVTGRLLDRHDITIEPAERSPRR
jgi:outer membrane protein TolC